MISLSVTGGWEPGTVARPTGRPLARATLLCLIGVVAAAMLATEFAGVAGGGQANLAPGAEASADAAAGPAGPERLFSVDGRLPPEAPDRRTAIGFLRLDDPLDAAVDVLGPPERVEPDIDATRTHTWQLPGDAVLAVTAGEQPPERITGLYARVPPGSPVRLPLYGGVLPGQSTLADVIEHWGEGYATGTHPGDDFALRYVRCSGPFPVVVKFDSAEQSRSMQAGVAGGETLASVLVAYADADPGSEGCPAV